MFKSQAKKQTAAKNLRGSLDSRNFHLASLAFQRSKHIQRNCFSSSISLHLEIKHKVRYHGAEFEFKMEK